ncbi:Serine/threonine-protein kinase tel1 [Ceratocystis fimbriata CBS 114723]|uniref:Serine/threonine-protein kinase tel1 n=1 Tax=Ceratocystis fimbriata CBS 114723 TaxID=1035309 RepID=A0A2C5WVZ1_9PEZI|nr:Serine/threonine-protein kinase tel1 [Ceratocystis fimbriata CBS 114723]
MAPENSSINGILAAISGTSQKARASGLDDLLSLMDKSKSLPQLTDKQYHRVFETLFQCTIAEKQQNARKSSSTAAAAGLRLGKCAKAVRLTYEYAFGALKRKTILAVIDHITQTLESSDGTLVALPNLVSEYLRALVSILSNPCTVEQLARDHSEGWLTCTGFCVEVIIKSLSEVEFDIESSTRASSHPVSSSGSVFSSRPGHRIALQGMAINVADLQLLLECLHHLIVPPIAPIKDLVDKITSAAIHVIRLRHLAFGRIPQDIFAVLSVLMIRLQADNIAKATSITQNVLPHIRYWWQPDKPEKEETVRSARDEILKTLFSMQLHLQYISQNEASIQFRTHIEDLLDTLWEEYSQRDEKCRLQLGDVSFGSSRIPKDYFQTPLFYLYYRGLGEERSWTTLECIASLEEVFYCCGHNMELLDVATQASEHQRKRRRVLNYNRIHQRLKSPDQNIQITALQLVSFLVQSQSFAEEDVWELLRHSSNLVGHKSFTIASWAMIASSRQVEILEDKNN